MSELMQTETTNSQKRQLFFKVFQIALFKNNCSFKGASMIFIGMTNSFYQAMHRKLLGITLSSRIALSNNISQERNRFVKIYRNGKYKSTSHKIDSQTCQSLNIPFAIMTFKYTNLPPPFQIRIFIADNCYSQHIFHCLWRDQN